MKFNGTNRSQPCRIGGAFWTRGLAVVFLLLCVLSHGEEGPGGAPTGWPQEFAAEVGPLGVRFESRSFWTLYRIDYKGERLGLDKWGSHYGSVAKFPEVGFIGSGHRENEDEEVLELSLDVDGVTQVIPQASYQCKTLTLVKRSKIRSLRLKTSVESGAGKIIEDVELQAETPTPVNLIYHFMHPWTPAMTHFFAETMDGREVFGEFDDDKRQEIDQPTRWSAVYNADERNGVFTGVLIAPPAHWRTRYWDVPDRYRKHYFTTFMDETIPPGPVFHYRIVTIPFEAPLESWKSLARELALTNLPDSSRVVEEQSPSN